MSSLARLFPCFLLVAANAVLRFSTSTARVEEEDPAPRARSTWTLGVGAASVLHRAPSTSLQLTPGVEIVSDRRTAETADEPTHP
ncbi:hypothetical protein [Opitutus sp. ER46]|uniref:hypothetical protein n=1 Tax=Opitutus sp. ER46 TaxID=2161864 RepID=UPI000D2FA655|nr:hypothetical protein [Opitutus sp. ER46]PTX94413.1 hypothetical protein DB354_11725 [Opitutus sp. ER46]